MEEEKLQENQGDEAMVTGNNGYENFNPESPYDPGNSFKPSMCMNFKTGEAWFGGGSSYIGPSGEGYLAGKNFQWNSKGQIVTNIVPSTNIYNLTKDDVSGSQSDVALVIDDLVDKTIVICSPQYSGNIIPDNAKKKVSLVFNSVYDSSAPNGTIIAKVHLINNSRVLLRISSPRVSAESGISSYFTFPSREYSVHPNVSASFAEVLIKAGGHLEAFVIKNTSAIGQISIQVLNQADFRQIGSDESPVVVGGVNMYQGGDVITKGFDNKYI